MRVNVFVLGKQLKKKKKRKARVSNEYANIGRVGCDVYAECELFLLLTFFLKYENVIENSNR